MLYQARSPGRGPLRLVTGPPLQVVDPPIGFDAIERSVERFGRLGRQDAQTLGLIRRHRLARRAVLPRMPGAGRRISAMRFTADRAVVTLGGRCLVAMRGVGADAAAPALQIVAVDV